MRKIRYREPGGTFVLLEVPWPHGQGIMPPPEIKFYVSGTSDVRTFVYDGDA